MQSEPIEMPATPALSQAGPAHDILMGLQMPDWCSHTTVSSS